MPEGDSIYRAAAKLQPLTGQVITRSDFRIPSLATQDLAGATVLETVPHGKHLLTRVETASTPDRPARLLTLHTHLKMEGTWTVAPLGSRWRRPWHTARVVLRTDRLEAVGFQVLLDLVPTATEDRLVGHLGPDLLDPAWDDAHAAEAEANLAADPDAPLGEALLEQRHLAGVGNVFKSEICFLTGLHPATKVGDVPDLGAVVATARAQLDANKDRPFRTTTGDRRAGHRYWVYGRTGPCLRCGTRVVKRDLGQVGRERPTSWCPTCQPAPDRARPAGR
ncbi:Fpg/Nei family DNA glycosylase [Nocardioides korecus]